MIRYEDSENEIIQYTEHERGFMPLIQNGFQDFEFERTIHEKIKVKK